MKPSRTNRPPPAISRRWASMVTKTVALRIRSVPMLPPVDREEARSVSKSCPRCEFRRSRVQYGFESLQAGFGPPRLAGLLHRGLHILQPVTSDNDHDR